MTWWQWCLGSLEFVTALLATDWLVHPAKRKRKARAAVARVAKVAEREERQRVAVRQVPPGWGLERPPRRRTYRPYRRDHWYFNAKTGKWINRAYLTTMPPAR